MNKIPEKETTFDRIFRSYTEGEEYVTLTPVEVEQKKRWETCFTMLCNFRSPEQVIALMTEQFSISKATAYRDYRSAVKLFGDVGKSNKEGTRYVLFEYSMRCFQLAASAKPPDIDQMNKSITNMIKLKGLDKEDPDAPDFSTLKPHIYNINLPENILKSLEMLVGTGNLNLSDVRQKMGIPLNIDHLQKDESDTTSE